MCIRDSILPSSAGRTTMCPTELMYDRARPASIRLLPIETRLQEASVSELRNNDSEWTEFPIDPADPVGLSKALASVRETIEVNVAQATLLGVYDEDDPNSATNAIEMRSFASRSAIRSTRVCSAASESSASVSHRP